MNGVSADPQSYLATRRGRVDEELARVVADWEKKPARLREAMAYSLLAPGKRIRPILALAACEAVGGNPESALPAACAIEMIHAFSLVHDDLPAMDDDDLRRGIPTCHKAFGEATAILAGDTLLAEAFALLADTRLAHGAGGPGPLPADLRVRILSVIARATGLRGMAGGQQMDLDAEGKRLEPSDIEELDRRKTAALVRASVVAGGLAGGAGEEAIEHLDRYGEKVGLAFQITDDLLDAVGDAAKVGKAVKKDAQRGKATLHTAIGLDAAKTRARELVETAIGELESFGALAEPLRAIARLVLDRTS